MKIPIFGSGLLSLCLLLPAMAATSPAAVPCDTPLSAAIPNSCVVSQGTLWRGAKPDATAAAELVTLGVKSVVNLELLHDDVAAFLQARPARAGVVDYFRLRSWEPNVVLAPRLLDGQVAEFIAIVRSQPKPVYVHCRAGQNRTGIMVAAYRIIEEGMPVESAIAEMGQFQGIWFKQGAAYLRRLHGERLSRIRELVAARMPTLRREARLLCAGGTCQEGGQ